MESGRRRISCPALLVLTQPSRVFDRTNPKFTSLLLMSLRIGTSFEGAESNVVNMVWVVVLPVCLKEKRGTLVAEVKT